MDTAFLIDLLFGFRGRINRAKYWLAVAIYVVFMLVIVALIFATAVSGLFFVVLLLYIPLIISGIAVGIKRLHDRDKSGWWLLVFYLLPAVLSWFGAAIGMETLFSLASFAVSIWMIVELGILAGTRGPNQYGPDPLA